MAISGSICCFKDVNKLAIGLSIIELVWSLLVMSGFFVAWSFADSDNNGYLEWAMAMLSLVAYLVLEIIGIFNKEKFLINFGFIVRVLKTLSDVVLIILFYISICDLGICNVDKEYIRSVLALEVLKKEFVYL